MTDWLCGFALFAGIFCGEAGTTLSGYVEGEVLFVAPIAVNRIAMLAVRRGDEVEAGATLVTMDADDARFALQAAQARLAEAEARLGNLTTGKRSEEIAVIEANRAAAKADLAQAELDLQRVTDLVRRKMQSQADLDKARTAHNVAAARLREMDANLQVAGIAARVQEIDAARRVVDAAGAELRDAEWRLAQRTLTAPSQRAHRGDHPLRRRDRRTRRAGADAAAAGQPQAQAVRAAGAAQPGACRRHPRARLRRLPGRAPGDESTSSPATRNSPRR